MVIGRGRPREHPKGTSGREFALPYFPGEALRVMFDDVIFGEKAPLVRILSNFGCAWAQPSKGTPFRAHVTFGHVTSGSHVGDAQ